MSKFYCSDPDLMVYCCDFSQTAVDIVKVGECLYFHFYIKEYMSDSFTNYNYVGNTKVSVSIKKTYANKCTLSEVFLTEMLKSFSVF